MTIKKTSNRSTVAAIEKDLSFIQGQHTEHQQKLEGARTQRLDAEKKQSEVTLDADTYNSGKAKKRIEELDDVVSDCLTTERRAERNVEACLKRIEKLEESLTQAKDREAKKLVQQFFEQLEGEAPGLEKLLANFTDRLDEMLNSCAPVDGKVRDLGADYNLRIKIEKALSGWLAAQVYHLFPVKFERPHRAPNRDASGNRPFVFDGDLKDVLARNFEDIIGNPKVTETLQPLIVNENFRIVPREEMAARLEMTAKMQQEAAEMKAEVVA